MLVRRPRRASLLHALHIEPVDGDLQNPAAVARATALAEALATIRDTIAVQGAARQAGRRAAPDPNHEECVMSTSSDHLVDSQVAGSPVQLPNDRTARISAFVVRIVVGLLWAENLSWKIPPHFGADDNSGLYNQTSLAVEYPVLAPYSAVVESVVLPNFAVFGWGVYIVEICLGLFLLLGLATRFWAVVGVLLTMTIFLSVGGAPTIWVWSYVLMAAAHLAVVGLAAGRVLGVDAVLRRRVTGGSLMSRLYRMSS